MAKPSRSVEYLETKLLKWRWSLVFVLSIAYTSFEISEHLQMHRTIDIRLINEVLIFGIITPSIIGGILSILNRSQTKRLDLSSAFQRQISFNRQLVDTLTWDELSSVLVRFPHSILPVTGAALVTISLEDEMAQLVTDWWKDDSSFLPLLPSFKINQCKAADPHIKETRLAYLSPNTCRGHSYVFPNVKTYCVNLVPLTEELGVQLFLFSAQHNLLQDESIEKFYSYIPTVSLAIQRAIKPDVDVIEASATQDERSRIARRIHDSLAQNISFMRLKIDILQSGTGVDTVDAYRKELQALGEVANLAYEQVRGTLTSLQKIPDDVDLSTALLQQGRSYGQRSGFEVSLTTAGREQNVSPKIRHQLIYLVQEALINVEKHAQATEVHIALNWEPAALSLTIKDNGVGFDTTKINSKGGHYGLGIMEERAKEINGTLTISSSPQAKYTQIRLNIPLAKRTYAE